MSSKSFTLKRIAAISLLDRLDFLRKLAINIGTLDDIPPFRVIGSRRQGERYSADGMRDLPGNRRLAAACVVAGFVAKRNGRLPVVT
ncbi:hypothetical protein PH552_26735 [Rhizobium sp. CNPSo 3968]|uniref:hypothetical protein n=1 Tax=Rhizobium sp. CNPSo 3968 TaxID=3021408 RepID=UPI00254EF0BA|nr:hypothetical protein [Rhizobium sp. CNPSo 3968]MDK4722955.1 hypothetical protein [Rhizobium sp. CNPSo 3968]